MPILNHRIATYTFNLDELKKLIASDLQVDPEKIKVSYNLHDTSDDRLSRSSSYAVRDITVTGES